MSCDVRPDWMSGNLSSTYHLQHASWFDLEKTRNNKFIDIRLIPTELAGPEMCSNFRKGGLRRQNVSDFLV